MGSRINEDRILAVDTNILILKLIMTPLIVIFVTLVARRWGESIGGLLMGLPLTSGPVSVFLAVEQGPHFAAIAANSAMLGLMAVTAFYVTYVFTARRFPWFLSAIFSIIIYLIVVAGLSFLQIDPLLTTISVPLVLLAGTLTLGRRVGAAAPISPPAWDLPARIIFATLIVVLITTGANTLGSKWSGILSPFPIFTFVMVTFSHRQGGPIAVRRFIQGVSMGLFSYVAFFLVIRSLVEGSNLWLAYVLATLVALLVNGTILGIQLWLKRAVFPDLS